MCRVAAKGEPMRDFFLSFIIIIIIEFSFFSRLLAFLVTKC